MEALKFVEEQLKEHCISEEVQYVLLEIAKQFAIVFGDIDANSSGVMHFATPAFIS